MKEYAITIRKYGNEQSFYEWDKDHKYPHYERVDEIDLGVMEFDSLHEAHDWILDNYPDYCYDMSISAMDDSGDFLIGAVKDSYWDAETQKVLRPKKSTEWTYTEELD